MHQFSHLSARAVALTHVIIVILVVGTSAQNCATTTYKNPGSTLAAFVPCGLEALGVEVFKKATLNVSRCDCGCYDGIFQTTVNNDAQCTKKTVTCATLNCHRRHRIIELESFRHFIYAEAEACKTLRANLTQYATDGTKDCYAAACTTQNTSTCDEASVSAACKNTADIYSFYKTHDMAKVPGLVVNSTYGTTTDVSGFKNTLTAALGVNAEDILVLVPEANGMMQIHVPYAAGWTLDTTVEVRSRLMTAADTVLKPVLDTSNTPASCKNLPAVAAAPQSAECDSALKPKQAEIAECETLRCKCLGYSSISQCATPYGTSSAEAVRCWNETLSCLDKTQGTTLRSTAACAERYKHYRDNLVARVQTGECHIAATSYLSDASVQAVVSSAQTFHKALPSSNGGATPLPTTHTPTPVPTPSQNQVLPTQTNQPSFSGHAAAPGTSSGGLGAGAVSGIAVGSAVACLVVVGAVVVVARRRSRRRAELLGQELDILNSQPATPTISLNDVV
eukprot:PhM_4_TR9802/c0_g1_i1/m.77893